MGRLAFYFSGLFLLSDGRFIPLLVEARHLSLVWLFGILQEDLIER